MITAQEISQEITLESLDDGPGLLPFRLGTTKLITHFHTFLQYIQLKDIRDKIEVLQIQLTDFKHQLHNHTYMLYELQIEYLSSKLVKVINHLETLETTRIKRGLIDGLGSVVKTITGNLDHSDALRYDNAIKNLQDNDMKIASQFNSHISLNNEWMAQHSQIMTKLIDNQSKINVTLQLILNSQAYRDSNLLKYMKFAQHLAIITENVDDVLSELIRIENMLAFIRGSSTHHSMISIKVLGNMIKRLELIYSKEQILDLELRKYYDIIKPGYYFSGNKIVITFKFPIFSRDTYDLYKLSVAPNKYRQALIPPYPLIATNRNGYVYMEAECPKYGKWYLCGGKMDHQLRHQSDCTQELIINQYLGKNCEMSTIILSRIAMEELDEKHYVISFPNATRIHMRCTSEDFNIVNGTYLVTIPVNCFLHTAEFTITNANDRIEGQPLKIMKLPYDAMTHVTASSQINLKSIDLTRLHETQHHLMTQPTLHIEPIPSNYLYHTTIPLYTIISVSVLILLIVIILRHYGILQCVRIARDPQTQDVITPTQEDIYTKPGKSEQHKTAIFHHLKTQK